MKKNKNVSGSFQSFEERREKKHPLETNSGAE